jgi:cytochrome c
MLKKFLTLVPCALLILSCGEAKKEKGAEAPEPEQAKKEVAEATGPQELANRKGCFACHGIKEKKVGPAYVEVARRYAGEEGALERLVESILKGSMGRWGSIPMAPQPVSREEARILAEWILSLK